MFVGNIYQNFNLKLLFTSLSINGRLIDHLNIEQWLVEQYFVCIHKYFIILICKSLLKSLCQEWVLLEGES